MTYIVTSQKKCFKSILLGCHHLAVIWYKEIITEQLKTQYFHLIIINVKILKSNVTLDFYTRSTLYDATLRKAALF